MSDKYTHRDSGTAGASQGAAGRGVDAQHDGKFTSAFDDARRHASGSFHDFGELQHAFDEARARTNGFSGMVRQNPAASVAAFFAAGLVIGLSISR